MSKDVAARRVNLALEFELVTHLILLAARRAYRRRLASHRLYSLYRLQSLVLVQHLHRTSLIFRLHLTERRSHLRVLGL